MNKIQTAYVLLSSIWLIGCSGSDENPNSHSGPSSALQIITGIGFNPTDGGVSQTNQSELAVSSGSTAQAAQNDAGSNQGLDQKLAALLSDQNMTGDPTAGLSLPSIQDPLSQLGMKLFFSKSLGGEMDSACVTCHHPSLGGTDQLSLGVGVEAVNPDLLGPGRRHHTGEFTVPRNAPTTFNSALYRNSLFWDSRVERLDGGIHTPDSPWGIPDTDAAKSLLEAQAGFPVTSAEEMRTHRFNNNSTNSVVRNHLAARIGGYNGGFNAQAELAANHWLNEFQTAFGISETAESLVNFDNIARALASYEASQVFVDNPWNNYLAGNKFAISNVAKRGAILFFTSKLDGGGHCSSCHSGDLFSDESHHVIATPQIGPGKGDGITGDDDFGLARETDNLNDRYKFRTPSLLNIAITAPYGHAGAYQTLRQAVDHYSQPRNAIAFFDDENWCRSITTDNTQPCEVQFPNARTNTQTAVTVMSDQQGEETIDGINLDDDEVKQIIEFLHTLTDPCTLNRNCLSPWIPDATSAPDTHQLNAIDQFGNEL